MSVTDPTAATTTAPQAYDHATGRGSSAGLSDTSALAAAVAESYVVPAPLRALARLSANGDVELLVYATSDAGTVSEFATSVNPRCRASTFSALTRLCWVGLRGRARIALSHARLVAAGEAEPGSHAADASSAADAEAQAP